MSDKSISTQDERREEKRSQFTQESEPRGGSKNLTKLLVVAALLLVGIGAYVVTGGVGTERDASSSPGGLKDEGIAVSVPLAELSGKASFYTYRTAAGKEVRFFVLKSSDGVYRAALDACDMCFADKQGYRQEGNDMVCNKCGNHFPSSKINDVHGGCNPVALTREAAGERLRINKSDLERGASYF